MYVDVDVDTSLIVCVWWRLCSAGVGMVVVCGPTRRARWLDANAEMSLVTDRCITPPRIMADTLDKGNML